MFKRNLLVAFLGSLALPMLLANSAAAQFCNSNEGCTDDRFCARFFDNCGGWGYCAARPNACTKDYNPVCGCDAQTYSNRCQAAQAGISVDYEGPCNPDCYKNADCPWGMYCTREAGMCGLQGNCQYKPDTCLALWDPVCGCNGNTYSNSCAAAQAGVSVDYGGECSTCGERLEPTSWPTSGYYIEMNAADSEYFHVWVTSEMGIQHIENWLANNPTVGNLGIPGAPIELDSTFNPGYSYRMKPDSVVFGEMWIELCDAAPCYIEKDVSSWSVSWCPWSARVKRVWNCSNGNGESCGTPVFRSLW